MDHFEVFGLPRRLAIDTAELQRRFYELSRRYHPDFHQAAPPEEQARALEASARLNAAYRALRDPIARVAQRDRRATRLRDEEARLVGPLSEQWDASRPAERQRALATIKESLAIRAYLRTVVDDLNDALGESQEGYVTNRRH